MNSTAKRSYCGKQIGRQSALVVDLKGRMPVNKEVGHAPPPLILNSEYYLKFASFVLVFLASGLLQLR